MSDIIEDLIDDLKRRMEENPAIELFVRGRNKFEGWLKVELVNSLIRLGIEPESIFPEMKAIDIVFEYDGLRYAIELKTVNTSYSVEGVEGKTRPITMNISSLVYDIEKLRNTSYNKKLIIFVAFPLLEKRLGIWQQQHLSRISGYGEIKMKELSFRGIPAKLYQLEVK